MQLLTIFILLIFILLIISVIVDLIHDAKTHKNFKLDSEQEDLNNLQGVSNVDFIARVGNGLLFDSDGSGN